MNIELVIDSIPYKTSAMTQASSYNNINIHASRDNYNDNSPHNDTVQMEKNKKGSKIMATSTFTPVSILRNSENVSDRQPPVNILNEDDDVGSKPLQWSKQFGYPGRAAHRKRDLQSEKNRNKPPPASQSEHLLDLIHKMLRRLCKKLALIIAKSYRLADEHRADVLNSNLHTPREFDSTIEKAVHGAISYSQGSVQFDTKKPTKQKADLIDSGEDTANEDDHSAANVNESQTLSISSHGSSKVSKGKKSTSEDSLSILQDALKLLSCVPNHRPLEEMATIYLWMLYNRPHSSNDTSSLKKRSKSLSQFTRSILSEFSEVVSSTKSYFVDYHNVCSDRGISTLKEEPQRERILMENMRCWHTEVGKRISEAQYESLCKSVKSTLSISRSFIYSQVSVTNDSTAAIGVSDSSLADKSMVPIIPPFAQRPSGQNMDLGPISKQINAALTGEDSNPLRNEDMKSRTASSNGLLRADSSTAGEYGRLEGFSATPDANDKSRTFITDKASSRHTAAIPKRPVSAGSIRRIGRYQNPVSLSPSRSARTSLIDRSTPSPRSVNMHKAAVNADKNNNNNNNNGMNNSNTNGGSEDMASHDVMQSNPQQSSANSFRDSVVQNRVAANSVLTRMHVGRFCFWNAAANVLCEKDADAVFALSKDQLKEFARHKIITDDSFSLPADAEFKQDMGGSTADSGFIYRNSSGSKTDDENHSKSNVAIHTIRSSSNSVLPQQVPSHQQDKESVFHRFAPQIDWRQQFLLQSSLFADICQSLLLSIFVLLKHTGAGKQIALEDVVLLLGNFTSELLGRKLLDKLLFWLHSNRRTDASFKLVNQTHLEMALQRLYSFWPSLQINLRMQQSVLDDNGLVQSEIDIPPEAVAKWCCDGLADLQ
eukprot:CAMPEP_0170098882 /NCGR_PEP_ID=MMETSP0020_2-20130122/693_1 /TAXON_ID=98059 /ORGANISM="Dinobryon sp., Strain UTEXLB2267" /LENGTH=882 /DNA_ID=CAMNT_0010321403 /DNA_START=779 /DNA_END=3428 /DNA_ORIENTATION=-